jgi:hypothetical protein
MEDEIWKDVPGYEGHLERQSGLVVRLSNEESWVQNM